MSTQLKLRGHVAIVTGATSGMGKAISLLFAKEGAMVVLVGRNQTRGQEVLNCIERDGGTAIFFQADVGRSSEVQKVIAEAVERFDKISIMVFSAGTLGLGSVTELSEEDWDRTMDTNLKSIFLFCKYGIPHMIKSGSGSIVMIGSIAAYKSFPNHPAYCASKGALIPLTKNLAMDYGRYGIRVNCLCPGPVDTPLIHKSIIAFPEPEKIIEEVKSKTVLGRLGTPDDIAKAALFLASDDSSWITGSSIIIDGGVMTGN